jgi:hypothetical protein
MRGAMMLDRYVVWTPEQIAGLRPLCTATYPPTSIVVHHTGGGTAETPQGIHTYHKQIGYGGCGYHYLIDRAGDVWRGRPVWARGAHCRSNNAGRIGVALLGDYSADRPDANMVTGLYHLIEALREVYGPLPMVPHRDVPGSSTDCPGEATVQYLPTVGMKWGRP